MSRQRRKKIPRKYQSNVLKRFTNSNALGLFHEMRLGKTLTTIWWMQQKRDAKRILLAAPNSVLESWQEELASEGETSVLLVGNKVQRAELSSQSLARWHIINHEGIAERGHKTASGKSKAVAAPVSLQEFDAVILDESTVIKNPKAQISKIFTDRFRRVKYRAVLSGLPNPESSLDFFCQMVFLKGDLCKFRNWWRFRERFYKQGFMGWDWNPLPGTLKTIREDMKSCCDFLTRKEAGVGNQRVNEVRVVDVPNTCRDAIESAERDLAIGKVDTNYGIVSRLWSHQICGGRPKRFPELTHDTKLRELVALASGELRGEPLVVWFRYRSEIDAAEKFLRKKFKVSILSGTIPREDRVEAVRRFRRDDVQILLCQYRAVRFGINLSHSDTAIYYSLPEGQEDYYQAGDRIEDPSKKATLLHVHLNVRDSIDEDIYEALRAKRANSKNFALDVVARLKARLARRAT